MNHSYSYNNAPERGTIGQNDVSEDWFKCLCVRVLRFWLWSDAPSW